MSVILKQKSPPPVADINVTPMVDVMLVLLIIFMVITPMLSKGVSVDLVKTVNPIPMQAADKSDAIIVAVTRDGKTYLNTTQMKAEDLPGKVKDMLTNRQQAFAERLPQVQAAARTTGISDLEQRRESLKHELTRAQEQADGFAFADAKERALMTRLERARAMLEHGRTDPQMDAARERYRRVVGALTWQLAQEFPMRMWDAKKDLSQLSAELARARFLDADLTRAQKEEPAHFEQFAARIAALDQRIRALLPRVQALLKLQRGAVQEMAVAELQAQKERLAIYGTQARFAVAQIYDRARLAKVPENATQQ